MIELTTQQEAIVDAYRTSFDTLASHVVHREQQHQRGLRHAEQGLIIEVGIKGVWSARNPQQGNASMNSYEKLGVHACTADLVRGWLEGGIQIVDHRIELDTYTCACGHSSKSEYWAANNGKCPLCKTRDPQPRFEAVTSQE